MWTDQKLFCENSPMFAMYSFQMFSYTYELLHFIRENTHDGIIIYDSFRPYS